MIGLTAKQSNLLSDASGDAPGALRKPVLVGSEQHTLLTRITAALDANPFADPITVLGCTISRRAARKAERDLLAERRRTIPTHTPQAPAREVVALPARSETHTPLQGRAGLRPDFNHFNHG